MDTTYVLARIRPPTAVGHHERVPVRWTVALPVAVYVAGAALQAVIPAITGGGDGAAELALGLLLLGLPVAVGCLLGWRVPASPVGAALAWVGAAPSAVFALEWWGQSAHTAHPWPAAQVLYHVQVGAWVWNLAGFAALCFVFPDGPLPGLSCEVSGHG